jgi:hypothetical protein
MADTTTYKRAKFILHTVSANEYSSGLVRLPIITSVISSGTDLAYVCQVRSSVGTEKTGFKTRYVKPSGVLLVDTGSFATGDLIQLMCTFV